MNIAEEHQASTPENNQPEQCEAAAPPRHADWISYATAVTQQPPTVSQATARTM